MAERIVRTLAFKFDKQNPDPSQIVGIVLPDGRVEGTSYKFDPKKIHGGVAITVNKSLKREGKTLINPATGKVFVETKKRTGYWNQETKTFVKVWNEDP